MAHEADPPDWSLLPQAPRQFFRLAADFTLIDLKRAYGRLLKLYKPEQSPHEFQLLRSAYESLLNASTQRDPPVLRWTLPQLRDSLSMSSSFTPVTSSQNAEGRVPYSSAESRRKQGYLHKLRRWEHWLETGDLQKLIVALRQQPYRIPEEWVLLDILETELEKGRDTDPLKTLRLALRAHPRSSLLRDVLYDSCRRRAALSTTPRQLIELFEILPEDGLFEVTEPLWIELLQKLSARRFVETFNACRELTSRHFLWCADTLLLYCLPRLDWSEVTEWCVQQTNRLRQHTSRTWQNAHEEQLTLIVQLKRAMSLDKGPRQGKSWLAELTMVIRLYCLKDPSWIARLQQWSVEHHSRFLEQQIAIPPRTDARIRSLCQLLQTLAWNAGCSDLANQVSAHAREDYVLMVRDWKRSTQRPNGQPWTWGFFEWKYVLALYLGCPMILCYLIWIIDSPQDSSWAQPWLLYRAMTEHYDVSSFAWGGAIGLTFAVVFHAVAMLAPLEPETPLFRLIYWSSLRPLLVRYLTRHSLDWIGFQSLLKATRWPTSRLRKFVQYISADTGLWLWVYTGCIVRMSPSPTSLVGGSPRVSPTK